MLEFLTISAPKYTQCYVIYLNFSKDLSSNSESFSISSLECDFATMEVLRN
jgi:hypothetical protein